MQSHLIHPLFKHAMNAEYMSKAELDPLCYTPYLTWPKLLCHTHCITKSEYL